MLFGQSALKLFTHLKQNLNWVFLKPLAFTTQAGYMKTCSSYQEAAGSSPGSHSYRIDKRFDKSKLRLSKRRKELQIGEYRRRLKVNQIEEEERLRATEGLVYGAGEF